MTRRPIFAAFVMALAVAPALAQQQRTDNQPGTTTITNSGVISSHQIDRYEAIQQLNASLRANPNNLTDWVLLGELAQEVALEVPADQAGPYYEMARNAYQNALKISPDDQNLRAAYAFAREQEANAQQFHQNRQRLTGSYLAARRRELSQSGARPSIPIYAPPPAMTTTQPAPPAQGQAPAGVGQPAPAYYPQYQPYYTGQQPYTYEQYNRSYFPPTTDPAGGPAAQPPTTLRNYIQGLPQAIGNEAARGIGEAIQGGATPPPRP